MCFYFDEGVMTQIRRFNALMEVEAGTQDAG